MLTILSCVLFPSCETDSYDADTSLAGSVSMDNYNLDAEITYDGVPMIDPGDEHLFISVSKLDDNKVTIYCGTKSGAGTDIVVSIQEVPLMGTPFNVAIDHSANNAVILFKDRSYYAAAAAVKGSLKVREYDRGSLAPRTTPATPSFICDLVIESIVDGKTLKLAIKSAYPKWYVAAK